MKVGRPKNKAAMSREDFCLFVKRAGSQRKAAKVLGVMPSTVRSYMTGALNVTRPLAERIFFASYHLAGGGGAGSPNPEEDLRAHCMPIKNPEKTIIRISRSGPTPIAGEDGVISRGCVA